MPPASPEAFAWLTTEKAAGLIAIIAAAGAYYFGGRKREKLDAAAPGANMTATNELLVEILGVIRSVSRQTADRAEIDHAVHVQIRDELRLLRKGGKARVMGETTGNIPKAPRGPSPID